jgi:hypothetical protein
VIIKHFLFSEQKIGIPASIEITSQIRGWICELILGDLLGTDGKEFSYWALEELVAWGNIVLFLCFFDITC